MHCRGLAVCCGELLCRGDERHTNHAGADVGADSRPDLADAPAGQLQILVHVVVYGGGKLLVVAVQQRVAVGRVHAAQLVQLAVHGYQRTGTAAAFVYQMNRTVEQRQHRFDAQCTAHEGDRSGQTPAFFTLFMIYRQASGMILP